jgi:hypothetical protein
LQLIHLERLNINRCALIEAFSVTPVPYMKHQHALGLLITQGNAAPVPLADAFSASTCLSTLDLSQPGDGLITNDQCGSLQWLSVKATQGQSYNEVLNGYGGYTTIHGFRFATSEELTGLFHHVDMTDLSGSLSIENRPGAEKVIKRLGCVWGCSGEYALNQAMISGLESTGPDAVLWGLVGLDSSGTASVKVDNHPFMNRDFKQATMGSYLVR